MLNIGKIRFLFYKFRREIHIYLKEKDTTELFLSDPTWLLKFLFITYITFHMYEFNLKLQGKDSLICDLARIVEGFRGKQLLFEAQLERGTFSFRRSIFMTEMCILQTSTELRVVFFFSRIRLIETWMTCQSNYSWSSFQRSENDLQKEKLLVMSCNNLCL